MTFMTIIGLESSSWSCNYKDIAILVCSTKQICHLRQGSYVPSQIYLFFFQFFFEIKISLDYSLTLSVSIRY